MFTLNSDITIGKFRFSGVNHVSIVRSLHCIVETATLKIPAVAKISKQGKTSPDNEITGNQFNEGDPVSIQLGYNGNLNTEFRGFVKKKALGMPLEISCEGYSWLLKRNKVNISGRSMPVKELLLEAIKGIDQQFKIRVECTANITLANIQINGNGIDVINAIKKYTDNAITCFFPEPDLLWCGFIYEPLAKRSEMVTTGKVKYRLGYNTLKKNDLVQRVAIDNAVEVKYSKMTAEGTKLLQVSDAYKTHSSNHNAILNQITQSAALEKLANEKAFSLSYDGYEGSLNTFLEPFAEPGYLAFVNDSNYPERDGEYLIESVHTQFGVQGARRKIELGPRSGFAKK